MRSGAARRSEASQRLHRHVAQRQEAQPGRGKNRPEQSPRGWVRLTRSFPSLMKGIALMTSELETFLSWGLVRCCLMWHTCASPVCTRCAEQTHGTRASPPQPGRRAQPHPLWVQESGGPTTRPLRPLQIFNPLSFALYTQTVLTLFGHIFKVWTPWCVKRRGLGCWSLRVVQAPGAPGPTKPRCPAPTHSAPPGAMIHSTSAHTALGPDFIRTLKLHLGLRRSRRL